MATMSHPSYSIYQRMPSDSAAAAPAVPSYVAAPYASPYNPSPYLPAGASSGSIPLPPAPSPLPFSSVPQPSFASPYNPSSSSSNMIYGYGAQAQLQPQLIPSLAPAPAPAPLAPRVAAPVDYGMPAAIESKKEKQPQPIAATPDPSSAIDESSLPITGRCQRCGKMFHTAQQQCVYHPGRFDELNNVSQGTKIGWSCCRVEDWTTVSATGTKVLAILRTEALQRGCPGCKTADSHLPDPVFAEAIAHFPVRTDAGITATPSTPFSVLSPPSSSSSSAAPAKADVASPSLLPPSNNGKDKTPVTPGAETEDEQFHRHNVAATDTLVGLSLRYGVSVDLIKRTNKLLSNDIITRKFLLIPRSATTPAPPPLLPPGPDARKRDALSAFRKLTGCPLEEAKVYLEDADYNIDTALAQWREDEKWERENRGKR